MAAQQGSFMLSALMSASQGAIGVGYVVIPSLSGSDYVIASAANLVAAGRSTACAGISLTAASTSNRSFEMQVIGPVPPSITGLGAGAAGHIKVSSAGRLERGVATGAELPAGKCDADGWAYVNFNASGDAEVADDIAKSSGSTIDRVQGFRGVPLDAAALSDGEVYRYLNGAFKGRHAMPKRWYDPRDYGAELDGETDDIAAFEAMHADLPTTGAVVYVPGVAYLSRTWRVSKRIALKGYGPELSLNFDSGFIVAPGYAALQFDYASNSLDGNDSSNSLISDLALKSRVLVHNSAGGSDSGRGIPAWGSAQSISVGDCRVKPGTTDPTYMFRASSVTANGGLGPATTTVAQPSWTLTAGATLTDSAGITWTTEKIPEVHQTTNPYVVGDRVWAPSDNRYYFECEIAGTSAGSRPAQLVGGDSAAGMTLDDTFTDGGVTWRIKCAAGIRVHSNMTKAKSLRIVNFTGYAINVVGGIGGVAAGYTNANYFKLSEAFVEYCGGGVHLAGSDCNGWRVSGYKGINIGVLIPSPNAVVSAGYSGLGGHHIHDVSLAGGMIDDCYGELNTARMILKNGLSIIAVISTFSEVIDNCLFSNGSTAIIGGSIGLHTEDASAGVVVLDPSYLVGRGLLEADSSGPVDLNVRFTSHDGYSILQFAAPESGDPNNFALRYASGSGTGLWALYHGQQAPNIAYFLYSAAAGLGYGPGWFGLPQGQLIGHPGIDTPIFDGRDSAIVSRILRGGARKQGDVFRSQTDTQILTGDGYRGRAWTANTAMIADTSASGINASMIEPTANTGKPGEQVWKCTTAGTTHNTTEPTWPASPTPGVTTQSDGSVTWTFAGYRPARILEQRTEDARGPHYRALSVQTTTATASQVLDSGGIVNGEDLALPEGSMCRVSHLVTVKKASTANGGTIEVKSDWIRNGSGAPAQIGSTTVSYNLSGSTLDATTVAHVANGNRIELQASPESADTLNWRVFRTQLEGVD